MFNFENDLYELDAKGLRRELPKLDPSIVNLSSNDYLGLSTHQNVANAAKDAIDRFGVGGTSSRLLAGTFDPHRELEAALAGFLGKEAALVFSSGYHLNTGVIPTLLSAADIVFFDRLSHASIIDGVRLSGAAFASFDHNDAEDLEQKLKKRRSKGQKAIVVTEGFFSMDGDRGALKEIVAVAHANDAWVYLDEAHSFGLVGKDGRGLADHEGVLNQIDIFAGTLSKTLGSQGGFVAGSQSLIDYLVSRCRSFIYTTALAPAMPAAALAALALFPSMEDRRWQVMNASAHLRNALLKLGFNTLKSDSPIVPVLTGTVEATKRLSDHLLSQGFFVPSIRPPTVSVGEGRVRLSVTFPVVDKLDGLIKAFSKGDIIAQTA